jgi:hypothetical protein
MTHPILSPARDDMDALILEGVINGVAQHGARYGLSYPRRRLLTQTLETLRRSMDEGWEDQFLAAITTIETGRPSQPTGGRRGDTHLSDPAPGVPR